MVGFNTPGTGSGFKARNTQLFNQEKRAVGDSEISAFGLLEYMKSAVHGLIGTGDYHNSGFRDSGFKNSGFGNSGFKNSGFREDFSNSGFIVGKSTRTGTQITRVRNPIGRFIIQSRSIRDKNTSEVLTAAQMPKTIILQKGYLDPVYDSRGNEVVHDQIPYTPVKLEIDPRYRGSIRVTLEKEIGTKRTIQLLIPLRETFEFSFPKDEMRTLETKRKTGGGSVYVNGYPIDEVDLLQYGRHFLEMETGEFYLHTGDNIQAIEMNGGQIDTGTHQIIGMSSSTKSIPIETHKPEVKATPPKTVQATKNTTKKRFFGLNIK